jgi:hypothetical protein
MRKLQFLPYLTSTLALSAILAAPALGADPDWVQPANEGVKSLTGAVVAIAGGVLGLIIVGYAVWGAIKQRLEPTAFVTLLLCGLIVGIGPALMAWWIGLFNKG